MGQAAVCCRRMKSAAIIIGLVAAHDSLAGCVKYSDGRIYCGDFEAGKFHGEGSLFFKAGDQYEGAFAEGTYHGTYIFKDGSTYAGDWMYGKRNGNGTFTSAEWHQYEGSFEDDRFHGQGRLHLTDGRAFAGMFVRGYPTRGVYTDQAAAEYVVEFYQRMHLSDMDMIGDSVFTYKRRKQVLSTNAIPRDGALPRQYAYPVPDIRAGGGGASYGTLCVAVALIVLVVSDPPATWHTNLLDLATSFL